MKITVGSNGSTDFATLASAIAAVPEHQPATIYLQNGIYREKIFCEKEDISLIGESREGTLLVYGNGAFHRHADGRPNGTFRSYTAFFSGGRVRVQSLTIANTAGDGRLHGQGIAAAVDAAHAWFEDVALLGCQDTLFTGPLPEKERLPDGFLGPKQHLPRLPSRQYYKNCYIRGDIDFIFGGATALFEECHLHCRGWGEGTYGYIAAPSTPPGQLGYVFYNCTVGFASAPAGSYYLARPWREHGAAAFFNCRLGKVVNPAGFDNWNNPANEKTARFCECKNTGGGAVYPRAFGRIATSEQAAHLLQQARHQCRDAF